MLIFPNWFANFQLFDWLAVAFFLSGLFGYRYFLSFMLKRRSHRLFLGKLQQYRRAWINGHSGGKEIDLFGGNTRVFSNALADFLLGGGCIGAWRPLQKGFGAAGGDAFAGVFPVGAGVVDTGSGETDDRGRAVFDRTKFNRGAWVVFLEIGAAAFGGGVGGIDLELFIRGFTKLFAGFFNEWVVVETRIADT